MGCRPVSVSLPYAPPCQYTACSFVASYTHSQRDKHTGRHADGKKKGEKNSAGGRVLGWKRLAIGDLSALPRASERGMEQSCRQCRMHVQKPKKARVRGGYVQ